MGRAALGVTNRRELEFGVLGSLTATRQGDEIPLGGVRQRLVLALLLLHAGQTVPADRLVDQIWGDTPGTTGTTGTGPLRNHIWQLRRQLGPDGVEPAGRDDSGPLVSRPGGYRLDVDGDQIDSCRFEQGLAAARASSSASPQQALDLVDGAIALWRGPAFGDLAVERPLRGEATRLDQLLLDAHELRAELFLRTDRHLRAATDLEPLARANPERERFWALLMTALYRSGRQAEALRRFQEARTRLIEDVGVEPGPELRQLEQAILRQEPTLGGLVLHDAADPGDIPALRSTRNASGALPRISTSFVGRQGETAAVLEALGANQLVTLTGEGGIGKTRLAVEAARSAEPAAYPDGVWFCDVSTVDDAVGLVEQLAAALGLVPEAGADVRAQLVDHVGGRRLLLLVDSSERQRAAIGELVADVVATGSDAKVLATSRAPLRTIGEHVIQVDPLPVHPGGLRLPPVQLLLDRARAAGAPVSADDPALLDVVRLLDGIPLAIELAAPRLATMSPGELAARLDRRFDLLTEATSVPPRQRTLRNTLDWSVTLLGGEARRLFGALSVFCGGWTLDAAEAVGPATGLESAAVASLVAELAEQSMIRVDLPPGRTARYRMLETMQAYAAEQLGREPDTRAAVAEAHAHHFVGFAEDAARHRRGELEPTWVEAIDLEFDNLRAAYRWSIAAEQPAEGLRIVAALVEDNIMRERQEIGRWAEELASLPSAAAEPGRALAIGLAAHTAMVEFRLDDAHRLSLEAIDAEEATQASPSWIPRTVLVLLAGLGFVDRDPREHLAVMDRISHTTGDPFASAVADFDRVMIALLVGDPARGRHAAERLLQVGAESQNPTLLAMGMLAHGRVVAGVEPGVAGRELHDALSMASSVSNTVLVRLALRAIQEMNATTGNRAEGLASLRQIALTFQESGNVSQQLQTVISMLDSLVALEAYRPLTTICGALSQTPWRHTATSRMIEQTAAQQLGRDEYRAAYHRGQAMPLADLAGFVSEFIRDLADD